MTDLEKARIEGYADGVLAEREHTTRALALSDVQRVRAEAAEAELLTRRVSERTDTERAIAAFDRAMFLAIGLGELRMREEFLRAYRAT